MLIAVIVSGDVKTGCLLDPLGGEADLRVPGVPRLLELCEQAAGWLQDKGVRQWLPGEVPLGEVCQQVDDGQWFVLRRAGAVVAGLRLLAADEPAWGLQPANAALPAWPRR